MRKANYPPTLNVLNFKSSVSNIEPTQNNCTVIATVLVSGKIQNKDRSLKSNSLIIDKPYNTNKDGTINTVTIPSTRNVSKRWPDG